MIWHSGEDGEVRLKIFAKGHDTGNVTASVAVIWCRPNSYYILVLEVIFVTLVDQLMCACNELQTVDMVELHSV